MFCDFFSSTQGSFIFHQVVGREGGWWDLRGRHEKNGFKGGVRIKNSGFKGGGGVPKNSFKFCCDGICNDAKSLPECQNIKNPSCVCAGCALLYENERFIETSTCQRLVSVSATETKAVINAN